LGLRTLTPPASKRPPKLRTLGPAVWTKRHGNPTGSPAAFLAAPKPGLPPYVRHAHRGGTKFCRLLFWVLHLTTAAVGCRMEGCWEGRMAMPRRKPPAPTPSLPFSNRRKAKNSTGPRTARGKAWLRLNRLRHGARSPEFINICQTRLDAPVLPAGYGREVRNGSSRTSENEGPTGYIDENKDCDKLTFRAEHATGGSNACRYPRGFSETPDLTRIEVRH
jgi:hypothetical protein